MGRKNTAFVSILQNEKFSPTVYYENCRFVGIVLALNANDEKTPKIRDKFLNLLVKLIDEKLIESESEFFNYFLFFYVFLESSQFFPICITAKMRSLLELLRIISSTKSESIDEEFGQIIVDKLFNTILALRSTTQSVSGCIKSCLQTIGNIMAWNNVKMNTVHLKLVSGLCGQSDFEIRTFAWSILLQLSQTPLGATDIVKGIESLIVFKINEKF